MKWFVTFLVTGAAVGGGYVMFSTPVPAQVVKAHKHGGCAVGAKVCYKDGHAKAVVRHAKGHTYVDGVDITPKRKAPAHKAVQARYVTTRHAYATQCCIIRVTSPKARTIRITEQEGVHVYLLGQFTGVTSDPGVQVTCMAPRPYMTRVTQGLHEITWILHECGKAYRGGVAR